MDERPEKRSGLPKANIPNPWKYAGLGVELAAAIIGLTLAGLWVDHQFGTGKTGRIVGGMYNFIRQAIELGKADAAARKGRDAERDDDANQPR